MGSGYGEVRTRYTTEGVPYNSARNGGRPILPNPRFGIDDPTTGFDLSVRLAPQPNTFSLHLALPIRGFTGEPRTCKASPYTGKHPLWLLAHRYATHPNTTKKRADLCPPELYTFFRIFLLYFTHNSMFLSVFLHTIPRFNATNPIKITACTLSYLLRYDLLNRILASLICGNKILSRQN